MAVDVIQLREIVEKEKTKLEKERKIQEEKEREIVKKEKAKLEKERKLLEKREKAAKIKEEMQRVGKEKKKKKEKVEKVIAEPSIQFQTATPTPTEQESGATTFFQTISKKSSEDIPSDPFTPFTATEKDTEFKIIPNVVDIISAPDISPKTPSETTAPDVSSFPTFQSPAQAPKKKETIICNQCGTMLSSDYAFCNKCGSKL